MTDERKTQVLDTARAAADAPAPPVPPEAGSGRGSAARAGTGDELPRFDFSELSWKDSKRASIIGARLRAANASGDAEEIERLFEELQAYLALVVVEVPRAWLVAKAPAALDWSRADAYDWLRASRMQDLQRMMVEAQRTDNASGN